MHARWNATANLGLLKIEKKKKKIKESRILKFVWAYFEYICNVQGPYLFPIIALS